MGAPARRVRRGGRGLLVLLGLVGLLGSLATRSARAVDGGAAPVAALRIGVAPFEGERAEGDVSQLLVARFERLGVEPLRVSETFEATRTSDPRADRVRAWARQSGADAIVVGRVDGRDEGDEGDEGEVPRAVEGIVRSGHSGAELFRHAVRVDRRAGLGAALDRLAAAIVRDLGGGPRDLPLQEAMAGEGGALPAVAAAAVLPRSGAPGPAAPGGAAAGDMEEVAAGNAEPRGGDARTVAAAAKPEGAVANPTNPKSDARADARADAKADAKAEAPTGAKAEAGTRASRGLETRIGVAEFRSDAPIEIKADEAELTAVGDDRRLIFQGGVHVQQDNVTLTSDRLEAEYVDGASEPTRLLAEGRVHVQQNDRAARCDRAEYLRSTQQITCRGHAELLQGCDVVRGELIVLDLAADRARVEGAASIVINPKPADGGSCVAPGRRQ